MPTSLFDEIAAAERARLNLDAAEPRLDAARTVIERLKAELASAEGALGALTSAIENDHKTWTAFITQHPTFVPLIEAKFKALADAGYRETQIDPPDRTAAAAPPLLQAPPAQPQPSTRAPLAPPIAADSAKTPRPPTETEKPIPEPRTAPQPSAAPNAPNAANAAQSGRDSRRRTPEFSDETVGPFNAPVPNKPTGSPSKKTNAEYRRIWIVNYHQGFDRANLGQPHDAIDAPGPSRDGRLKGYEDGLKHKEKSGWKSQPPGLLEALNQPSGAADKSAPTKQKPSKIADATSAASSAVAEQAEGPSRADRVATIDSLLNHAVIEADFGS